MLLLCLLCSICLGIAKGPIPLRRRIGPDAGLTTTPRSFLGIVRPTPLLYVILQGISTLFAGNHAVLKRSDWMCSNADFLAPSVGVSAEMLTSSLDAPETMISTMLSRVTT